jgi:hypothetical protein
MTERKRPLKLAVFGDLLHLGQDILTGSADGLSALTMLVHGAVAKI